MLVTFLLFSSRPGSKITHSRLEFCNLPATVINSNGFKKQEIIQKKSVQDSHMLPLILFDKTVPFNKYCYGKTSKEITFLKIPQAEIKF